jgi:HPt (histidine-containing phosphotransfer) domain-containing protein
MTPGPSTSPDHGIGGNPAIDRSVLGEWLAGDDAAINELLAVFRDSVLADLARMRELLTLANLDEFADATHRLRGAALSMGAHALADFTALLLTAAKARDGTTCATGMPALEAHIQLVAAEVPAKQPDPP